MSAHVQEYPTIGVGFAEESRSAEVRCGVDLHSVTLQDGSAHLTGSLATVDEENPFPVKIGVNWRLPKHSALRFRSGQSYRMPAALSKSETASTTLAFCEPFTAV